MFIGPFLAALSLSICAGLKWNVEFEEADIKGEAYVRPLGASAFRAFDIGVPTCESDVLVEQVHINIGADEGSIVVSYTASGPGALFLEPTVYLSEYGTELLVPNPDQARISKFTGSKQAYSSLLYIVPNLYAPTMGAPGATVATIVKVENTSSWAYDPVTNQRYTQYKVVQYTSSITGLQAYNNPYAIYDSPMVFTVELYGLKSKTQYFYRPAGGCKVYHFTSPYRYNSASDTATTSSVSPFPAKIGLLADLGQTDISVASVNAIAALGVDYAVLVGDLSYADGYPLRWDSFGRLIEPVFAYLPLLTTGGNHEVGAVTLHLAFTHIPDLTFT